jgi:hypothetical protein
MIDEDWLASQRFTTPQGVEVVGLKGIGSEKVVFEGRLPDGRGVVLKTYKHHLGYHIRELPLVLTGDPRYNVERLNNKLLRLVGDRTFDGMTRELDRLYSCIIQTLFEDGVVGVISSSFSPDSVESIPFILHTPGTIRRLEEIAALADSAPDPQLPKGDPIQIASVNGANFPIMGFRSKLRSTAAELLRAVHQVPEVDPELEPDSLPENPLYVWGAAVMDGFFTDEELPIAVAFIRQHFGPLTDHPKLTTIIGQVDAIGCLLAQLLKKSGVERFVRFCAMNGLAIQVTDRRGSIVVDGLQMLLADS